MEAKVCLSCHDAESVDLCECTAFGKSPQSTDYASLRTVQERIMDKLELNLCDAESKVTSMEVQLEVMNENLRNGEKIYAPPVKAARLAFLISVKNHEAAQVDLKNQVKLLEARVKAAGEERKTAKENFTIAKERLKNVQETLVNCRDEAKKELAVAKRKRDTYASAKEKFASHTPACNAGPSNSPAHPPATDPSAADRQSQAMQTQKSSQCPTGVISQGVQDKGGASSPYRSGPEDRQCSADRSALEQRSEDETAVGTRSPSLPVDSQENRGTAVAPESDVMELELIVNGRGRHDNELDEDASPDPEKITALLHPEDTEFAASTGVARRIARRRRDLYLRQTKNLRFRKTWTFDEEDTLEELVNEHCVEEPKGTKKDSVADGLGGVFK